MKFSEFLKTARKEKGLSQLELALDTNIDQKEIGLYEREKQQPKMDEAERIAGILDYEITYVKKG